MVKTIRLEDDELHSQIGELGNKNETYEDIIRKVVEFYKKNKNKV